MDANAREAVYGAVARCLEIERGDLDPEASLEDAYGAESLDYLDIAFAIEEALAVVLPRLTVLQHSQEAFGVEAMLEDGVLTARGASLLRLARPGPPDNRLEAGMAMDEVSRLVTADTFLHLVDLLLQSKERQRAEVTPCPQCGGAPVSESDVGPEFVCSQCQAVFPYETGDQLVMRRLRAAAAREGAA